MTLLSWWERWVLKQSIWRSSSTCNGTSKLLPWYCGIWFPRITFNVSDSFLGALALILWAIVHNDYFQCIRLPEVNLVKDSLGSKCPKNRSVHLENWRSTSLCKLHSSSWAAWKVYQRKGNQSVQISDLSNYDNLDFQLPVTQPAKQLRYEQETSKSQSPRPKIPVESVSLGISAFITMKKKTIFQSINVGGQKHSTLWQCFYNIG